MKVHALADIKQLHKEIQARQQRAKEEQARRQAQQRRTHNDHQLFVRAVGPVQPLAVSLPVAWRPELPQPIPVQRQRDEAAVLREALSDGFDVASLLDTDEGLSFRRPGVGVDVTRRLRRGDWSLQKEIDLHGLRSDEAREALGQFIRDCHKQGLRCVRVVHGKGLGSPGKEPVLKHKVHSWLVQKNQVLAFVQAKPAEGGAGALVVLLQPQFKRGVARG